MIGREAPKKSADAILGFETAIAEVSWSNAGRRDLDKTYNPMSFTALNETAPFPAAARRRRPRGRPPKVVAPLDQHYVALRDELQRTLQTIGLAA
jgi:predicted metalloendopeptidase